MKNLSRNVTLYCDICGNDQFSTIDDLDCELQDAPGETKIKCSDCGKIFTKDELLVQCLLNNSTLYFGHDRIFASR